MDKGLERGVLTIGRAQGESKRGYRRSARDLIHPQPLHDKGRNSRDKCAYPCNDPPGAFPCPGGFGLPLLEGVDAVVEAGVSLFHLRECPADPADIAVRFMDFCNEFIVHGYHAPVVLVHRWLAWRGINITYGNHGVAAGVPRGAGVGGVESAPVPGAFRLISRGVESF